MRRISAVAFLLSCNISAPCSANAAATAASDSAAVGFVGALLSSIAPSAVTSRA